MKHLRKQLFLIRHKNYFDKGYSATNYFKYLLVALGFVSKSLSFTLWIGISYAIFCYILGFCWFKYRLTEAENEFSNIYNPFVKEVRAKLNGKRFK